MTPLAFVVITLAIARGTMVVTTDEITQPVRDQVLRRAGANEDAAMGWQGKPPWYVRLALCDWCVSFWLALVAAIIGRVTGLIHSDTWAAWCWPAMATSAGITLKWAS